MRRLGADAPSKLDRVAHDLEVTAATCRAHRTPDTPASQRQRARRSDAPCVTSRPRRPPNQQGRLGKPVEFGYKAQVVDNDDGVVLDHNVEIGNTHDAPMLEPAIKRVIEQTKSRPKAVTADRGYGEHSVSEAIAGLGVSMVALPFKGNRPQFVEQSRVNRSSKISFVGAQEVKAGSAA